MTLDPQTRAQVEISFHQIFNRDAKNIGAAFQDSFNFLVAQGVTQQQAMELLQAIYNDVVAMAAGQKPWPDDVPPHPQPQPLPIPPPVVPPTTDVPRAGWSIPYSLLGRGGATSGAHAGPYKIIGRDHAADAQKVRNAGCNIIAFEYTEWIMTGDYDTPARRAESEKAIAAYDAQKVFLDFIATNTNAPRSVAMSDQQLDSLFTWLAGLAGRFSHLIVTPVSEGDKNPAFTNRVIAAVKRHFPAQGAWLDSNVQCGNTSAEPMFKMVCTHQRKTDGPIPAYSLNPGQIGYVTTDGGDGIVNSMADAPTAAALARRVVATGSAFCAYSFKDDYDWNCVAAVGAAVAGGIVIDNGGGSVVGSNGDDVDLSRLQIKQFGRDIKLAASKATKKMLSVTSDAKRCNLTFEPLSWPQGSGSLKGERWCVGWIQGTQFLAAHADWCIGSPGYTSKQRDFGNLVPGPNGPGMTNGVLPAHGQDYFTWLESNDCAERTTIKNAGKWLAT